MYYLFISHSWAYGDAYEKLVKMLDARKYFQWHDYSIPKDDPVHDADNDRELTEAIRNKIIHVNCVVILAGVYSTYSKWINKEIRTVKELGKPVVAVQPWGAERTSVIVKENADEIVGWNSGSIVDAIRRNSI